MTEDFAAVATELRKEGQEATALLLEMGMMQLIIDFRKRARAENIDRTDQINALAKMFASTALAFASSIKPLPARARVLTGILTLVEGHMHDTAQIVLMEDLDG